MAHRTNVIQVTKEIHPGDMPEIVTDPVCEKQISRRESRHMLAQGEDTVYFCSKECQSRFVSHKLEYTENRHSKAS